MLVFHRRPPRSIRWGCAVAVGALSVLLAGCQASSTPKASSSTAPAIVSLNPCSDAILSKITRPGQLLAVSHYSHEVGASSMGVAEGKRYAAVSGSVEEIAKMAPDIVVADIFLAPATAQAIRDLGIQVVTIGSINSIQASIDQVRELARVAKNTERGEMLVKDIEHALEAASSGQGSSKNAKPIPAIVWQSGGIVAGDTTLIAELLRQTGFVNSAATRGLRQADYLPLEAMLTDPPKVILASGDPASQEDRLLSHPALAALKDTRRVPFDSTMLWCGGPTIVKALGELSKLHRELASSPREVGL